MKKRVLSVLAAVTLAGSMLTGVAADIIPRSMQSDTTASREISFGIQGGKAGAKSAGRIGVVDIAVERDVEAEVVIKDEDGTVLATGEKKKGTTNTYTLKTGKKLEGMVCEIVVTPKDNSEGLVESAKTVRFPKR